MKTKKTSDDIFRLAKSLSKVEAGYFIQYINRSRIKEAAAYIQLFKHLRSADEYNESELKAAIKNPAFIKRFAYHKTILSDLIIESMVAAKSNTSVNARIHRLIEAVDYLREKHLYPHTLKLLGKARELAQLHEKYFVLLHINFIQRALIKQTTESKLSNLIDELYTEKKELLEKIENEDKLGFIGDKVFSLYWEKKLIKTEEDKQYLENLMQNALLSDEKNAISFSAKIKYNSIFALYHQLTDNYKEAYKHRKRMVALWDLFPHFKTEDLVRYRSDLTNLLSVSIIARIPVDFEEILKEAEKTCAGNKEENAAFFSEIYFLRQSYMLNNGQITEALELIPEIEKGLKKYAAIMNQMRRRTLMYNVAITYFLNEKYNEALPYFEQIANINRTHDVRKYQREVSSLFKLIILYQTGKHDLAEYEVRNTRDRLKYGNKLYELELLVLEYIPLLIKSQKERPNFLAKLEELFSRPENKNLLGLEEIIIWLRKKV
jgi:hypothetical protein